MTVRDDLRRSRPSTAFRAILAIPHFVWIGLWGTIMLLLLPIMWVSALATGRPVEGLREVYAMYLRYTLHVYAYASLAADPFPGFLGRHEYPIDLAVPPPERQGRWSVAFRAVLAIPPYLFAGALGSGIATSAGTAVLVGPGVAVLAGLLAWFAALARARMPAGLRDVLVWTLAYAVQTAAYLFLVTGAYPDSDPRAVPLTPRPRHPVRLQDTDASRRHRLLVAFRLPLAAPHFAWLTLWSAVALLAALAAWVSGIILGRVPLPLHRFLAAYVRYSTHLNAFASMAGGPFPGFAGTAGSYPVDLEIDDPGPQSRWSIGFRWLLAVPALLLTAALGTTLAVGATGAWCWALLRGRMPGGLHAALAYAVRYTGQSSAYALLVTGAYPHSGPSDVEASDVPPFLPFPERPALAA